MSILFTDRVNWLRAERADLLQQLNERIAREDQTPAAELPVDWGVTGDLARDIQLLQQLLRRER